MHSSAHVRHTNSRAYELLCGAEAFYESALRILSKNEIGLIVDNCVQNDMKFSNYMVFWNDISKKMTCSSAKCYSTAIYTTIMVVLSLQLVRNMAKGWVQNL